MVQREGCWVRRTSGWLGQVREEVGPCTRAEPQWAEDRATRVVQECAVRADHQWQTRAVLAWSRGEPLPPQEPDEKVLRDCMAQSTSVIAEENEREALAARLADAARERDALRAGAEQDRAQLRDSVSRMTDHLGEAAKKEAPPAIATASATSEGHQSTDGRTDVATTSTAPTSTAPPIAATSTAPSATTSAAPQAAAPPALVPARGTAACEEDATSTARQERAGRKGTGARRATASPSCAAPPDPPRPANRPPDAKAAGTAHAPTAGTSAAR
jgi:hypothetical protein